ncbi:MAG TPA: hypothetical protein VFR44_12350 [Actinomycetota bacterium]|nr:hypothetical protein [Actinomycetota bacterium]
MRLVLIHTDIPDTPRTAEAEWEFTPKCKEGACDAILHSISGKYEVRVALDKHGNYRWVRHYKGIWWCDSGGEVARWPARVEHSIRPISVRLTDGRWIVSRFDGTALERSTRGCGFLPAGVWRRYAIRAKLVG